MSRKKTCKKLQNKAVSITQGLADLGIDTAEFGTVCWLCDFVSDCGKSHDDCLIGAAIALHYGPEHKFAGKRTY